MSGKLFVPAALTAGRQHGTHRIAGWVSPRTSTDILQKQQLLDLSGLEPRTLQSVAQSLYQLRHSVSFDAMARTYVR